MSGGSDGQKVAMQEVGVIGRPLAVFRSLVNEINKQPQSIDWFIAVNTISTEGGFWDAAKKYEGKINEIDLVFAAPNIWKGDSETEKALRELHKENAINETEVKLKNTDGRLNPGEPTDDSRVATSVDFISRGGGRVRMKSRRRIVYDSQDNVLNATPNTDHAVQDTETEVVSALAKWLLSRQ